MAPHLRTAGIDLHVTVLHDRPGYADELRSGGTPLHVVPRSTMPGRVRSFRALLRRLRADVVHTTLYESDVVGRVAGALTRTPVVCTLANVRYGPDQYAEPGATAWKLHAHRGIDVVSARAVRRFHAVSGPVAEAMAATLHVAPERMVVIPRGRDPERLGRRTAERRAAARRALGLGADDPVVVTTARHEHQKGLDVLIDAAAHLGSAHPSLRVLVAGSPGRQTAALEGQIRAAGLAGIVELLGARDDVPELLAAADVFVLPSRREGFPGAVVEAMALETPLVLSDIPMMHDAVPDQAWARFVPLEDATALADAVRSILADPVGAADRARAARRHFEAQLTVDAVSRRMADLLLEVGRTSH
jgi:glycosyltransferase involved in cell wall biosynthesis